MNLLRQRLLEQCPPLHIALENSWNIANDRWLASIPTSAGSYNSAPHFRNIEGHLERLLVPASAVGKNDAWLVNLSPLEIYLLLASVLFHDYGRVHGDHDHAYASKEHLPKDYAALGIPSRELANCLGRIAVYHDPVHKLDDAAEKKRTDRIAGEREILLDQPSYLAKRGARINQEKETRANDIQTARQALADVTIEPYGRVRELHVATLLALADHLDASVIRTEPDFIRPEDKIDFKGAFRRLITGSTYDFVTGCIKTCLCHPRDLHDEPGHRDGRNLDAGIESFEVMLYDFDGLECYPEIKESAERLIKAAEEIGKPVAIDRKWDLYKELNIRPDQQRRQLYPQTLKGRCRLKKKSSDTKGWPHDFVLAIVLKDLKANREFLRSVKDDLEDMGLPLEDWLIEYKGKTYDDEGFRIEEPVFRLNDFKRAVAHCMEELSTYAFAHSAFSYEVLADSLRTDKVELVKLAVKQLARDNAYFIKGGQETYAFTTGNLKIRAFPETWELRSSAGTKAV